MEIIKFVNFARYEVFIIVGVLMSLGTIIKLLGFFDFSSDWFWLLAGVGLVVEGGISLVKQQRFENKFKVVSKEEYERLMKSK